MPVDEPRALEGVADDGDAARPGGKGGVEQRKAEEDVVVRVQGAVFDEDGARARGPVEVAVGGGEVGVALGFR